MVDNYGKVGQVHEGRVGYTWNVASCEKLM